MSVQLLFKMLYLNLFSFSKKYKAEPMLLFGAAQEGCEVADEKRCLY